MSSNTSPIGVFDSGIGGVTILRELVKILPTEDFIYLSDDANCPYGLKSNEQIIELAKVNTKWLLDRGVKLIVVACNTATMASIATLREQFKVKFVGIEPAIKPATFGTKTGAIGVLATESSVNSKQLKSLCDIHAQDKVVVRTAGVGLVDIVERDIIDTSEAKELLESYLEPMFEQGVDHLVLGCTHYPFLTKKIEEIISNRDITIINPAWAVARQAKNILQSDNKLNTSGGKVEFFSTSENTQSTRVQRRFKQYCEIDSKE